MKKINLRKITITLSLVVLFFIIIIVYLLYNIVENNEILLQLVLLNLLFGIFITFTTLHLTFNKYLKSMFNFEEYNTIKNYKLKQIVLISITVLVYFSGMIMGVVLNGSLNISFSYFLVFMSILLSPFLIRWLIYINDESIIFMSTDRYVKLSFSEINNIKTERIDDRVKIEVKSGNGIFVAYTNINNHKLFESINKL